MANTTLTASIITAEALMVLNNKLGMANNVFRGHDQEYSKSINGYKVGDTVTVMKPTDFTVRSGATADSQDVTEGSTTVVVDKQKGIDFKFNSADMALEISDFSTRIIEPAMVQLANQVDRDLHDLYVDVNNWVGTAGQTINSFADYAKAMERLDENACPTDNRFGTLSPADHWGLVGNQTSLFVERGSQAYRDGSLGNVGGVETFMSQNVATHTGGTRDNTTPVIKTAVSAGVLSTTYATSKDLGYMDLSTDGHDNAKTIKKGDVFTIDSVFDVNPVTKVTLAHLKMFTVVTDVTAEVTTTDETTIRISPPIIVSGAHQTCSAAAADGDVILFIGTASTGYRQNMVFNRKLNSSIVQLHLPPLSLNIGGFVFLKFSQPTRILNWLATYSNLDLMWNNSPNPWLT